MKNIPPCVALTICLLTTYIVTVGESGSIYLDAPISGSIKLGHDTSYIFATAMSRVRNPMDSHCSLLTKSVRSLGSIFIQASAIVGDSTLIIGLGNVVAEKQGILR